MLIINKVMQSQDQTKFTPRGADRLHRTKHDVGGLSIKTLGRQRF